METIWFPLAVTVLLAVLVGVAVPTLSQLRRTLKTAEAFLDTTGRQLETVLREGGETARRINHAAGELEDGIAHARAALASVKETAETFMRLRRTVETIVAVGGVVGPALVAAVQAFLNRGAAPAPEAPRAEAPAAPAGVAS